MAIVMTQNDGVRTIGVDRASAVNSIVEERRKVVPIERSGEPIEPEPAETTSADKPAETPSADKPLEAPKADPVHMVEIERRERALDAARHEHELLRREHDALKARLTDPEEALRAAGYTPDKFIERWLGAAETKPAVGASTAPPEQSALEKRLAQLEAERDQERATARARDRRQEIESFIPADSEDFAALNGLREFGALDQLIAAIDHRGQGRQGGLGPQETKALIAEFEGNSRKTVEQQVKNLAKSKWGRTLLTELVKGSVTTSGPFDSPKTVSPPETSEDPFSDRRSMSLRGRTSEELRERVKSAYLRKTR